MSPQKTTPGLPFSTPLRLELGDTPLRIKIEEKEPRPSWSPHSRLMILIILGLVAVVVAGIIWAWSGTVIPRQRRMILLEPSPVPFDIVVDFPQRLAQGDSSTIHVEIVNQESIPLPGVRVTLLFSDAVDISLPAMSSNVLDFSDLAAGEYKHRELVLRLMRPAPIAFTILVSTKDGRKWHTSTSQVIYPGFLPYIDTVLRRLTQFVMAMGVLSLVVKTLWDRVTGSKS